MRINKQINVAEERGQNRHTVILSFDFKDLKQPNGKEVLQEIVLEQLYIRMGKKILIPTFHHAQKLI